MITHKQREELRQRLDAGESPTSAGRAMGLHHSTVVRFRDRLAIEAGQGAPFEMPPGHAIKGTSVLLDPNGIVKQRWVKTKADGLDPVDAIEAIKAALADFEPRAPFIAPPAQNDNETATVYIAADWHVGLLAWKEEVGQNWDLKIAQKTVMEAMTRLVAASPPSQQAVVLGLGDLLHSDSYENMTARSKNVLDVDGRYPRLLQAATRLIISTVALALEKHETVLVRILPGNHDTQSAIAVSLALAMFYADDPRVTVDDDPSYFWWFSFGRNLIGATHGDQAKMKDLPLIMAARNPEAWGRSKFRAIYTGHVHHQSAIEVSGVTVESFQTPTATDSWHHRMGYGANRSVTSVTLHWEHGEISRQKVNIV